MDRRLIVSENTGDWSPDECYLAIWAYDSLDEDRSLYKRDVFQKVARMTGRNPAAIALLLQQVAGCDSRPADQKPVDALPGDYPELKPMFEDYWQNRHAGRGRYAEVRERVQEQAGDKFLEPPREEPPRTAPEDPWKLWRARWTIPAPCLDVHEAALQRTSEHLNNLQAFPGFLRKAWTAHPFDPEGLDKLAAAVGDMDRRTSGMTLPPLPDPEAHAKAKRRWIETGRRPSRLERREIRLLCQHPSTAVSADWVSSLAHSGPARFRRSWIEHLFGHYLAQWRNMADAKELETALHELLARLSLVEPWGREFSENSEGLIGPETPRRLLQDLPNPLYGWAGVTAKWDLSREAGLGQAVMLGALESWQQLWRNKRQKMTVAEATTEIRDAFDGLLSEPGIPGGIFTFTIASLILSEWAKDRSEIRNTLLEKLLLHPRLGDPRRQPQNWYPMAEARDRVISWMARKDLRFFYDSVVSDHSDDQGRKAFWLRYVDQVSDFRLVLGEEDQLRMSAMLKEMPSHFAQMEGTNKPSAFILKFRSKQGEDLICVEFSRTGNSLYVYDAASFEAGVGSLDALYFRIGSEPRNLKSREYSMYQKRHIGDWQWEVAIFLKNRGIGMP